MSAELKAEVDVLLGSLKQSITDPEKQEMLKAVAADAVRITSMMLMDPEAAARETAHVKATMANLGSAEASNVAMIWTDWATGVVTKVITKVLPV
jgi:hypothetical protein